MNSLMWYLTQDIHKNMTLSSNHFFGFLNFEKKIRIIVRNIVIELCL